MRLFYRGNGDSVLLYQLPDVRSSSDLVLEEPSASGQTFSSRSTSSNEDFIEFLSYLMSEITHRKRESNDF